MLSIGAMGGGQGGYYIGLAREDYYLEGGEPPGRWLGAGAESLGLAAGGGVVEREAFLNLFDGFDARGGGPLVQNAGDGRRQPGWDLTFSAPKSVSLVWALAGEETRRAVADAHFAAVKEALAYVEAEHATTRRGHGGAEREKARLVVAAFEHGTSRAQDPQLHTHALVLNVAVRQDGTTGTVESKPFYRAKMAAGALYRAELAHRLEGMGFAVARDGASFEVRGVPEALVRETSKRRAEIEAALDGRSGPASAAAAAVAALATRSVKEHVARDALFAAWRGVGEAFGFGRDHAEALRRGRGAPSERAPDPAAAGVREVLDKAAERLTQTGSHFGAPDLLRAAAEEAQGRGLLGAALLRDAVAEELAAGRALVPLGQDARGETRYTTRALLEVEKRLLADVEALRAAPGRRHGVDERTLRKAVERVEREETAKARRADPGADRREMNREQRDALAHVTRGEQGSVALVSGMAGTGKTFLLRAAREAWEASGYTVVGAAVAGKAARGLHEGAGIESMTLARLLWEPDPLGARAMKHHARQLVRAAQGKTTYRLEGAKIDDKTVLVVDEAGMVGTRDMARLAAKVKEAGAKLVLVGDARQLQPVDVGGPFRAIEGRLGSAKLTGIVRQKLDTEDRNPLWRREAVADFADGKAERGLRAYAERGLLSVAEDRPGAMRALIGAWKEKGAARPNESLIFAGTRREVRELNRMAQAVRDAEGALGFRSVRVNGETVRESDRVLVTRNDPALGVNNGDLGTVKGIDPLARRMELRLDDGRLVTVPLRQFDHVELGYAVTTHKGQGATVENAYVLCGGGMSDREMSYVQASRARGETRLFTERLHVWDREQGARVDRTVEQLAYRMGQSRQKDLAHDIVAAQRESIDARFDPRYER